MYEYCKSRGVQYNQCGKLIVATNEDQYRNHLPSILQRGIDNGVHGLKLLRKEDVQQSSMEPEVQ